MKKKSVHFLVAFLVTFVVLFLAVNYFLGGEIFSAPLPQTNPSQSATGAGGSVGSARINPVPLPEKIAFITSTPIGDGDFDDNFPDGASSYIAATGKCLTHAANAGLSGVFAPWISTSDYAGLTLHAKDQVFGVWPGFTDKMYVRTDGVTIAKDSADLTDGSLQNPITFDEFGNNLGTKIVPGTPPSANGTGTHPKEVDKVTLVWTGTGIDGTLSTNNDCNGWTVKTSAALGTFGRAEGKSGQTTSSWTDHGFAGCGISQDVHIYCFEV